MALTLDQKRIATTRLHPTVGFMIGNDGLFKKWKSPLLEPTVAELEAEYVLYEAEQVKLGTSKNSARTIIINNKATIKQLSTSLQNCKDFVTADTDALAKSLFLLTNLVVFLAHEQKLKSTDYIS